VGFWLLHVASVCACGAATPVCQIVANTPILLKNTANANSRCAGVETRCDELARAGGRRLARSESTVDHTHDWRSATTFSAATTTQRTMAVAEQRRSQWLSEPASALLCSMIIRRCLLLPRLTGAVHSCYSLRRRHRKSVGYYTVLPQAGTDTIRQCEWVSRSPLQLVHCQRVATISSPAFIALCCSRRVIVALNYTRTHTRTHTHTQDGVTNEQRRHHQSASACLMHRPQSRPGEPALCLSVCLSGAWEASAARRMAVNSDTNVEDSSSSKTDR